MGGGPPPEPPTLDADLVQRGGLLFLDARLSADGTRACATCHPGGGSNGRVYERGREVEPGAPGGRRTPELRGLWQTPPYLWDGSLPTVRAAIERMLAVEMGGAAPSPLDVDALEAYVLSIPPFDNGRIAADGAPVEPATLSARRGAEVFARVRCINCHRPPSFARTGRFDVDTGGRFSVPSLRNVSKQPRLGHDGRWKDLETAVVALLDATGKELTNPELQQLLRYLELL